MFGLLFFLLKEAMVLGSFGMSIIVFVKCLRYFLACCNAEVEVNSAAMAECQNTFGFSVIVGAILRFLYWLLIPDLSNTLAILIITDLLAIIGVILASVIFMIVPFHRISKEKFRKVSIFKSTAFIKYSIAGILAEFVVIYLTGFPGTI